MKKTTTVLFLGLALISFKATAQDTMFNDFEASQASEIKTHELMKQDTNFLSDIEKIQKNITFMQLELKEKELEYKVLEQAKKMQDLENPVEETVAKSTKSGEGVIFDKFIPSSKLDSKIASRPSSSDSDISIVSIKGMKDNLKATLKHDDMGVSVVSVGDVLNNGYKVVSISKNSVTLENTKGDVEVIGISFRM